MIAAVTRDASGFEGLNNYRIGGGRPTAAQAFDANARQPAGRPGTALPGAPDPIPTSSAHPGKQTNQRIPYARLATKFPMHATGGLHPEYIQEGDVVFAHRFDGMYSGHDTNKATRMATIAQLNAMLMSYDYPKLADDGTTVPNKDLGYILMPAEDTATNQPNAPRGRDPPPLPAPGDDDQNVHKEYDSWQRDPARYRWQHCSVLAEWALDGICCGTEHEHRTDAMVGPDGSNPGELYNVAVGGPTLVRNDENHKHGTNAEQHIDDGVRVLDKVFVGLVCYENRDTELTLTHYHYQYMLFTARQIAWASFQRSGSGAVNAAGPSVGDFHRMCCVWRLGSVLDAKAGTLPYKCATLNVVVEEWELERVAAEYNQFFGLSYYLAPIVQATTTTILVDAARALKDTYIYDVLLEAHTQVQLLLRQSQIDTERVRAEVRAWRAVDEDWLLEKDWPWQKEFENWEEEDLDHDARGPVRPARPARPSTRPTRVGPTSLQHIARNTDNFYYEPASVGTGELFDALHKRPEWLLKLMAELRNSPEQVAIMGRTAALRDSTWLDDVPDRNLVRVTDEAHTHYLGVLPVLNFWSELIQAHSEGWEWPLSPN